MRNSSVRKTISDCCEHLLRPLVGTAIGIVLFLTIPSLLSADEIASVTIQGIEDRLYDNVVLFLAIHENRNKEDLSRARIERLHRDAPKEIAEALQPFGYYSVNVSSSLKKDAEGWHAVYRVEKGQPVRVAAVDIRFTDNGDIAGSIRRLTENFSLRKGDILDHTLYDSGKKRVLQHLLGRGYIEAKYVTSEIRVNIHRHEAEINLVIDPGERFYFGRIVYDQNLLDPEFLAGFINFEKGEPYSRGRLVDLQQILYRTNYFGKVVVRGLTESTEGRTVPVEIRLTEPPYYNRYTFGLGYATDIGVRGKIGWDNRLFTRSGHSIKSELNIAQRESSLDFVYGIPILDPRFDKMLLGATYNEQNWDDIDTKLFRGGLSYEHSGGRFKYGFGVELRNERYEVGVTSGESFLPVPNARWSVVYGDDLIHTRHGLFFSLNLRGASENLWADATFLQGVASVKVITTPFAGLRLIGRGSLGATAVDDVDDLPPSLRFFAGGDQSVRGYAYRELASRDASGTVVGGKHLIFGSIEAEKTVYQNWSMAVFFDAGKGVNSFTEDLGEGAGVGVRYRLPFGQIRLDIASALSEEDNPLRVHLTLGGDF